MKGLIRQRGKTWTAYWWIVDPAGRGLDTAQQGWLCDQDGRAKVPHRNPRKGTGRGVVT